MQITTQLLLVRPVRFGFNAATAVNNVFQQDTGAGTEQKAIAEFDAFAELLQKHKVDINIVQDTPEPHTPDSIFPNNWISFHEGGGVFLYPMFAPNRRAERKETVMKAIAQKFMVSAIQDLTWFEKEGLFLEGTGSMVLDRENRIAYACLSPRTHEKPLLEFCRLAGYKPILFRAFDSKGLPIYHTNVMMSLADEYVVICLESIPDRAERNKVEDQLHSTGKIVLPISLEQVSHFAGNMLQVVNTDGERLLILSSQAWNCLQPAQLHALERYNRLIHSPLDCIETAGGGSARCMLAEIFLSSL